MKNIFSLLMALTILAGANAGERLTLSRKPFFTKAPIAVVADKAPAQLAGTTIDIVCDSVHIYDISDPTGYEMMRIVSANDNYAVSIVTALTQYYGTYDANIGITPKTTGATQITADGKVTLGEEDNRILVTSTVTASDGNTYNIRMQQAPTAIPECKDTVTINIPKEKATFANKLQTEDAFMIQGKTTDLSYAVSLQPTNVGGKVAGIYTASQLDDYYSFVVKDPDPFTPSEYIAFLAGTVKVIVAGGTVTAVAELVGEDAVYYKIMMSAEYDEDTRISDDAEDGSIDVTYTTTDNLNVNTGYFAREGAVIVEAINAAYSNYTALEIYPTALDPNITLPAGTYTIDYTGNPGTIMASQGWVTYNGQKYLSGSAYTTVTVQGSQAYMTTPYYFMVSGKAVVENNNGELKITVDAVNSYDRPIHVVINAGLQTAIEHVNADAAEVSKYIRNGQMYILRNGNVYTATGALVK